MHRALVLGGTSGLGLEIASQLCGTHDEVLVVGRHDPVRASLKYIPFEFREGDRPAYAAWRLLEQVPEVSTLVCAVGAYQRRPMHEMSTYGAEYVHQLNVAFPVMVIFRQLELQERLDGLIVISSTSAFTPRPNEAFYCAAKAGLEQFTRCVAESGSVGATLLVAPAGMKRTGFYRGTDRDTTGFLEPQWVAEQTCEQYKTVKQFREVRILRSPAPHVEVVADK